MKKCIFILFFQILLMPSLSSGADFYEEQLNRGIRNSEPYSYLLIKRAETDPVQAKSLLRDALRYSPDLPAVYFELSRASFSLKPENVFEAIDYIIQGIAAYKRNFWWLFMIGSSLYMSLVLSFVAALFIIVLTRLPQDLPLFSHDIQEGKGKALILFVLLFALFGPLYLLGGLLLLSSFYMKKWDRVVLYLYLLFLLVLPVIFYAFSLIFTAAASGHVKAVVQVNEARGNSYALSLLKGRNEPAELFSYALAQKREGGYREAIDAYQKLLALKPEARTYNNLANCYVALNDIEKAKELYRKAAALKELPAVSYNLSQVHRESLDFDKGEEYFFSAQKMDKNAVSRFRSIAGRNPNRFVIDIGLPGAALWEYARSTVMRESVTGLSLLPFAFMPVPAVVLFIIFYAVRKYFMQGAYRCKRCGRILCNKCEKHIVWGHMCIQCYRSLVKLDELDAKERIARILAVYAYQKKRRDLIKIISFIVPGLGQIYAGSILYGFFFLWAFLFFLSIPLSNMLFVTEMSHFSHFWLNGIALFFMIIIYLVSNIITRRRLAKGWL
jgi:pentatricopeptide repeat protein